MEHETLCSSDYLYHVLKNIRMLDNADIHYKQIKEKHDLTAYKYTYTAVQYTTIKLLYALTFKMRVQIEKMDFRNPYKNEEPNDGYFLKR